MKEFLSYILAPALVIVGAVAVLKTVNFSSRESDLEETSDQVAMTKEVKKKQGANRSPASNETPASAPREIVVPPSAERSNPNFDIPSAPMLSGQSVGGQSGRSRSTANDSQAKSKDAGQDQEGPKTNEPKPPINAVVKDCSGSSCSQASITTTVSTSTTGSSSQSGANNSPTYSSTIKVVANHADATVTGSISVTLSFDPSTATGTIFYCKAQVAVGASCSCDPKLSPTTYSSAFALGNNVAAKYCAEFYGVSSAGQEAIGTKLEIIVELPDVKSSTASGTYSAAQNVSLSFTPSGLVTGVIKYCKSTGAACTCDPISNPTTYAGAFNLGASSGGEACAFYYGVTNDGVTTAVRELQIDTPLNAVVPNVSAGSYTNPQALSFTYYANSIPSTLDGDIYYCLDESSPGQGCCDPTDPADAAFTHTWTATVTVGNAGNGSYCLSYFAVFTSGATLTTTASLSFAIDSIAPAAPVVDTNTIVMQTTEQYKLQMEMGNDPLLSIGQVLSFHRLDSAQLASSGSNCNTIASSYPALDLDGNGTPDTIDFVSYLMTSLDVLVYGSPSYPLSLNYTDINYIVSVVSKPNIDVAINNCAITPIIMQDFEVFSDMPSYRIPASDLSGSTLTGEISPYGYFEGTESATGTTAGKGRYDELRSDFMNMIH